MKARYVILSAVVGLVLALGFHNGNGGAGKVVATASPGHQRARHSAGPAARPAVSAPRRSALPPRASASARRPSVPPSRPSAPGARTSSPPGPADAGDGWLLVLLCAAGIAMAAATVTITARGIRQGSRRAR